MRWVSLSRACICIRLYLVQSDFAVKVHWSRGALVTPFNQRCLASHLFLYMVSTSSVSIKTIFLGTLSSVLAAATERRGRGAEGGGKRGGGVLCVLLSRPPSTSSSAPFLCLVWSLPFGTRLQTMECGEILQSQGFVVVVDVKQHQGS